MVFFDPHTWAPGLVTSDMLNAELRDQLVEVQARILALESSLASVTSAQADLLGGWIPYTPDLQADILPPNVGVTGGGHISGKYKKIGKTCVGSGDMAFGNTMNRGSGNYYFTLPVAPIAGSSAAIIGSGAIYDASEGVMYTTVCRISGTRMEMLHTSTLRRYQTTALLPIPMYTSDTIFWNFMYEVLS